MQEACGLGFRDFGENRVQEFLEKKELLPGDVRWHFIGHLQTNKVKNVLGTARLIHSLDRMSLAEEIQKQAEKKNIFVDALIEVNTSGEASKSGFRPEETAPLQQLMKFNRIRLHGLMTIGPMPPSSEEKIRMCFKTLRSLRDQWRADFPEMQHLSMGMSSDFETAIEEGATMIRIGTAVFGEGK